MGRPLPGSRAAYEFLSRVINAVNVLTVNRFRKYAKGLGSRGDVSRGRLAVMGILIVLIVFADVDHRQVERREDVHRHPLHGEPASQRDRNHPDQHSDRPTQRGDNQSHRSVRWLRDGRERLETLSETRVFFARV